MAVCLCDRVCVRNRVFVYMFVLSQSGDNALAYDCRLVDVRHYAMARKRGDL